MGAHERGKVGGVTRLDQTDGARRVIIQRGETSSIIGGWKFIEEDIADKEEVTETAETITKIAKKG